MKIATILIPPAVVATTLIAAAGPDQQANAFRDSAPARPSLLINEVMFDPPGVDGSAIGGEWIELYSTRALDIGGWILEDNAGNAIGSLPPMSVPAHSVIAVFFRDSLPLPYDGDASDRSAALALGLALGDHLPNRSGGVRLKNEIGVLQDQLYWSSTGAPIGSNGSYFDLSFATGKPLSEGDSLGRPANPLADYSGTLADWERNGGANAAGATPGGRNGVEVTDMTGLKFWAQTGVNQIITGFGNSVDTTWFSIFSASVENSVYGYQPNVYSVTSDHIFAIDVWGVPTILRGPITATFTRNETAGSVGYQLSAVANLRSSAGYSFSFVHTEDVQGFHTNTVVSNNQTSVTYGENAETFDFSVQATNSRTWVGDGQVVVMDDRTATDYGGAGPKRAFSQSTVTRVSDGTYDSSWSMIRDRPIGPPPPTYAGSQSISGNESYFVDTTTTSNDMGEITSGQVFRLDRYKDGYPALELEAGQVGSFGFGLTSGVSGQYPQTHVYQLDLPLLNNGVPFPVSGTATGRSYLYQGRVLTEARALLSFAGTVVLDQDHFVDPPVQACKHCPRPRVIHIHRCTICDPEPPAEPAPPAPAPPPAPGPKTPGGFMTASAICSAAGAGYGAGIGGTIGAIAGGISGAAAGGVGVIPGIIAGAKAGGLAGGGIGSAIGSISCGFMYLTDQW